jgi:putative endonuclease
VNKHKVGLRGQDEAENFLARRGCEILARNYRIRSGEIDLIARDGEYIAFVEVKFRTGAGFGLPRESVTAAKQRKIIRAALHYIAAKNLHSQDFRFDVIEVFQENGQVSVEHIENAFGV